MKLLLYLISSTVIVTVLSENCDRLGVILYEDLGCTPEFGKYKSCPIRYSCDALNPKDENNCRFRGRIYKSGETIEDKLTSPSCDVGCVCVRGSIICAVLDCPEWLGVPVKQGCYRNFTLEQCCSVGSICPALDNVEKCVLEGGEYKEGEQFYPKNTCLQCVCRKGFKGKFEEPFCRRVTCGVQLRRAAENIRKICAPFYRKSTEDMRCCPDDWICPIETDEIKGDAKSEDVCKFGDKILKLGQKIERTNVNLNFGRTVDKLVCECMLPPLLTCTEE